MRTKAHRPPRKGLTPSSRKGEGNMVEYNRRFNKAAPVPLSIEGLAPERARIAQRALMDLDLESLLSMVVGHCPKTRQAQYPAEWTEKMYLECMPLTDHRAIEARMDTVDALVMDERLLESVTRAKLSADTFLYTRKYQRADGTSHAPFVQKMENTKNLVGLVRDLAMIGESGNARLQAIRAAAQGVAASRGFAQVASFIDNVYAKEYLEGNLGDHLYSLCSEVIKESVSILNCSSSFLRTVAVMREILDHPGKYGLRGFLHREHESTNFSNHMGSVADRFARAVTSDRRTLLRFLESEGGWDARDILFRWGDLVNEACSARLRGSVPGLAEELGFYVAGARLQQAWKKKGAGLLRPVMLPREERTHTLHGTYSPTLYSGEFACECVPNDIFSSPEQNLFVITGPNNGGKTTYVRTIAQAAVLLQMGVRVPCLSGAESEENYASVLDAFYSVFTRGDSPGSAGKYQNLVKSALAVFEGEHAGGYSRGMPAATPYSAVFIDEFGDGTDYDEADRVNREVVLYGLYRLGATTYFSTHLHSIAESVEKGDIMPQALNLAIEICGADASARSTFRILRGKREKSYGRNVADAAGLTKEGIDELFDRGLQSGRYTVRDTRA